MSAPTREIILHEIKTLQEFRDQADHTLWHVADVLIRVLEFHKHDGDAFWKEQSWFDRLLASFGLICCCPYSESHFNDGEPLNYAGKNALHPYYQVPVRGCNCDRCSMVSGMIMETCQWVAGLNDSPPSLLFQKLEEAKTEFERAA